MHIILPIEYTEKMHSSQIKGIRRVYTILISLSLVVLCMKDSCFCDHLRQSTDEQLEASEAQIGDTMQQKIADPDYIKRELKDVILRSVDSDKDGYVSYEELKNYLMELHEKNIDYNVEKQWVVYQPQIHEVFSWEGYEPEKKEVLTWDHYFNQTYPELIGVNVGIPINREQDTSRLMTPPDLQGEQAKKMGDEESKDKQVNKDEDSENAHLKVLKLMVHRADARWKLADENGDTLLTRQEFKYLLHPDEGHEELQNLFVREATEDMDLNKDGNICLDEFMKHLQVLATDQERNDHAWLSSQQENFGRFLDKNKDGVLDDGEIKDWLVPAKSKKFGAEAKRLMDIGDNNEDHKLSNAEIVEQYEQYVSLLPAEYWQTGSESQEISESILEDPNRHQNHDEL